MSLGQGINIKLYSGKEPWDQQFYSSTCDNLFIGGQGGGKANSNCPYVHHKDMGVINQFGNSFTGAENVVLSEGQLSPDYFNTWFINRPFDLKDKGVSINNSPGVQNAWYQMDLDVIKNWNEKARGLSSQGYNNMGGNAWDWALETCRNEYGSYLNPDVKCDDPVCKMESVVQTNPVYFESACQPTLHSSCVRGEVAKSIAVPVAEALVLVAVGIATDGAGDAALLGAEAAEEGAAVAVQESAAIEMEEITSNAVEAGINSAEQEGTEAGETIGTNAGRSVEDETKREVEKDAEKEAEKKAEEEAAKKAVDKCTNFNKSGVAKSAEVAKSRGAIIEGLATGAKAAKDAVIAAGKYTGKNLGRLSLLAAGVLTIDASGGVKDAYEESFNKNYQDCISDLTKKYEFSNLEADNPNSPENESKCKIAAGTIATGDATQTMGKGYVSSVTDYNKANNYETVANALQEAMTLKQVEQTGSLASGVRGVKAAGGLKNFAACNKFSTAAQLASTATGALIADSVAHEECYTCEGQSVRQDMGDAWNPLKSGIGVKPELPYRNSQQNRNLPAYNQEIVKPYCFIPNRRGSENYCPIFGDTAKFENDWYTNDGTLVKGDPNWFMSKNPVYQKYQGSILGTTDYEVPENRPFWTLKDLQSRVQTGKQGLHSIIEGDTLPAFWNKQAGLDPASEEAASSAEVNAGGTGGRKWTNYGYVCNYNHTDDFITNPIQAENFLNMTVGPIDTLDPMLSGAMSETCAKPMVFADIRNHDAGSNNDKIEGEPRTAYSKFGCALDQSTEYDSSKFSTMSLSDKISYYFNNDEGQREMVLGQGTGNEHYEANIIPVPTNPNIPYNRNFRWGGTDGDITALLPDKNPQFTGQLPWLRDATNSFSYPDFANTNNPELADYKLPSTFWYEHPTFNKVMADYCIRKGPRFNYGPASDHTPENSTASHCQLEPSFEADAVKVPGKNQKTPTGTSNKNAIRQYCPNMFLPKAGAASDPKKGSSIKDECYNCSIAEGVLVDQVPKPSEVCDRWYAGMISTYKNLSNITKQNPTYILDEYHKAVDEYCNIPEHRDLQECSCHNADNMNNPTKYGGYFDLWSSFENSNMGTKGMKYCWLTPCVPDSGGFLGTLQESIINFKDPAAYVNSNRQVAGSSWKGKCPHINCEEFLMFTDNTQLTDTHINEGISACGGQTVSNEGYICGDDGYCSPGGRYINSSDPIFHQTKATCEQKCKRAGPLGPTCIQTYYKCQNGKLVETDKYETSQFWKGEGDCDTYRPTFQPPAGSSTSSIIDVTIPSDFDKYSSMCQKETMYSPSTVEDSKKNIVIFLVVLIFLTSAFILYSTFNISSSKKLTKNIYDGQINKSS